MPTIYLSPSTQEFNPYVDGSGSEEYYMNLIADAMIPYLNASGIGYTRNTPEMTAASSIAQSNAGNYDLHLALHSNASAPQNSGQNRGVEVYFYPQSTRGRQAAEIIADNMRLIYPDSLRVRTVPTTSLGEVVRTRAPSVLIEYAFHDNYDDAAWIRANIDTIARYTVLSLAEFFGIPFNMPQTVKRGVVRTPGGGSVNIRVDPDIYSQVIGSAPNGATVTIYAEVPDWYVVKYGELEGYMSKDFIEIV
ncbi:MAG: N-acetylmuramoyl-L-alanine amidase [Clostridia bacterium]|nr:N-acetylmuramoyl-L-alanine amidase [Clostridia bacterium]